MTTSPISSNPLSASNATAKHTYGLSGSGIDVDAQVKALMTAASVPYVKMWQKEQQAEWKKAEYNTFYNSINTFNTSTVFNYTLQSTLQLQLATSSSTTVASATANADAAAVSHSLAVTQLAAGVSETSSSAITTGATKDTLVNQFGLASGTFNISITNNGVQKTIAVDPTQSINSLVSNINNAGVNVKANYDATLDRFFLYTTNTGSSATIDFSGTSGTGMDFLINKLKLGVVGAGSSGTTGTAITMTNNNPADTLKTSFPSITQPFTLNLSNGGNSSSLTIDPNVDTLNSLISKVSGATDPSTGKSLNAVASYNAAAKTVTLQTTSGTLSLTGSDPAAISFLINQLNLPAKAQGQDAKFTLDGASLTEASNNFTISGVNYNLLSNGTTTVSVTPDINKIVSNVQSFVDSYNTMLSSLNTEISQPVFKDFLPLTDDQKSAMKDSDIIAWTAKAKSGLLYNDSILQGAINNMRNNISDPISGLTGTYTSAASIGITTGNYTEQGKLHLDTSKLQAALQADPTIVYKIFGTTGSSTNTGSQGIAVRLNKSLNNVISQIKTAAGMTADTTTDTSSNLALQISDYQTRLTQMSTQLQALQTRYYNQFSAMETALQKMNSQSSFISSLTSSSIK